MSDLILQICHESNFVGDRAIFVHLFYCPTVAGDCGSGSLVSSERVASHPGPVLIDAAVNRMELAMPPKVTTEMAKGFSLYMLKAVLNGRVDEVVGLARSNLRR